MSTTPTAIEPATPTPTLLRLATAGSVDDGKSTLVGRLLHDTRSVLADQLQAIEDASRRRGWTGAVADLALLTDGLRAEREQGITIDVAYRYFATATRSFVLADCPGHVQYTRNTVTGASTADVVLVLIDARHGVVEQTRRHLAVVSLLRVPHVVVAVNKIDLVENAADVYDGIVLDIEDLRRTLDLDDVIVVPVSALHGDNVVEPGPRTAWYAGPTLLEVLESLPLEEEDGPARFPVQLVIRPQHGAVDPSLTDYRGYAGHVASGTVRVGDEVVVASSGVRTRVVAIDRGPDPVESASAPLSVTLRLADDVDISRGDVIAAASTPPTLTSSTDAVLCWLNERPLAPGARVLVSHGTRTVRALVTEIHERLDIATLSVEPAQSATLNDLVRVTLTLAEPLPLEPYSQSRHAGSLLVIDPHDGWTLAAGMVAAALPGSDGAGAPPLGEEGWL
ncbi:MAG: sulfate adenylyltransferase [Intrasporangiaceae bacterium]|nr:sulfate adenylyltransferase [Intrasporangiaceae bacterium]